MGLFLLGSPLAGVSLAAAPGPYGLGDRAPTPEEAAYVEENVVEVGDVNPNALAAAREIEEWAGGGEPPDGLASAVDNSTLMYFPPIRSQGSQGSCTTWAACYYYNTFTQARDAGWNVSGGDNTKICSPAFMYPLINWGSDGGAYTAYAVAHLSDVGSASWDTMPYSQSDWTTWPTEAAWLEALQWRTQTAYQINGSSQAGITAMKQHVANGNVGVTRFNVYSYWYYQYPSNTTGINNRVYYAHAGSYLGGHAVTIVGYDDNKSYYDHRDGQTHYGAFLIANSWGSGWGWYNSTGSGSKGFFWVAYDMFLESAFGPYLYFNSDRDDYEPKLYAAAGLEAGGGRHDGWRQPVRQRGAGPAGRQSAEAGVRAVLPELVGVGERHDDEHGLHARPRQQRHVRDRGLDGPDGHGRPGDVGLRDRRGGRRADGHLRGRIEHDGAVGRHAVEPVPHDPGRD
jgi:hypothetical protein